MINNSKVVGLIVCFDESSCETKSWC